jgi:hypothetical protein
MVKETMTKPKAPNPIDNGHDGKDDNGKLRYDLIPVTFLEGIAKVLTYGADKYGANSWQTVPDGKRRYIAAAFRHLVEHCKGNANDTESGLPHLAHLAVNVMFLYEYHCR